MTCQKSTALTVQILTSLGGITGSILNTFERSLRGAVSNEIQKAACDELGSLGTTLVKDMLDYVRDQLDSYFVQLPPDRRNALYAENHLEGKSMHASAERRCFFIFITCMAQGYYEYHY